MIGEQKPSLEELRHYGVKGMRWKKRGKLIEDFDKAFPVPRHIPGPGRMPFPKGPIHKPKQPITDASQIKLPKRRTHNAAIDAYLRGIRAKRLLGEQKAKDILAVVGDTPFTTQDDRG